MPGCNGQFFTLQSPKTGSLGRAGWDSRWDLSRCVHQSAVKAVSTLATWRKKISKADISRRVLSGTGSRNKESRQCMFLIKVLLFTYGQMLLLHSSRQVRKHWREEDGGSWNIFRGRDLVSESPVSHRNHCELEHILWNLIEDKEAVAVASWKLKLPAIVI